jgi:lipopolysaccharide/colanic/teichoic acid biosynthesis glycosyltransferase
MREPILLSSASVAAPALLETGAYSTPTAARSELSIVRDVPRASTTDPACVESPAERPSAPVAEVVVVTRNSREQLELSLAAIRQAAAVAGARLLFIDLGSTDGTQRYAASHSPGGRAVWLTNTDRPIDALAVAAACSKAEVLVILDPTLEPSLPDSLVRLVEHLRDHPYAGIAAPALRCADGELLRSTQPAPLDKDHSRVEWVVDAAFAIRRADLDAVARAAGWRDRSLEELRLCLEMRRRGLEVHYVPSIELIDAGGRAGERAGASSSGAPRVPWRLLLRHPRFGLRLTGRHRMARRSAGILTRALELAITIPLLVMLAPVMVAIAIAVRLDSVGPSLFRQVRLGRRTRPFEMYKFRTMRANADPSPHAHFVRDMILGGARSGTGLGDAGEPEIFKVHPDPRVTRVGRLLRRTSLDELPQLFNVLRGDMTLVGFRPPIPYEIDSYPDWYHRRFDGKPGITGLWQVSGRNERSYEEMVRLDIEYLNRRSWLFDAQLLVRTVRAVLGGRGAY